MALKLGRSTKTGEFHWYVEGVYMGISTRTGIFRVGHNFPPSSAHWFCPTCGRVWARCVPADASQNFKHTAIHRECDRCNGTGSLGLMSDELAETPRLVLEREVLIASEYPDSYMGVFGLLTETDKRRRDNARA